MPAFSGSASNQIQENIRALFQRVKAVSKIAITHEDFASLFIPAEHRAMYREMSVLSRQPYSTNANFEWGGVNLTFRMHHVDGKAPLAIPHYLAVQHDAPKELVDRITEWIISGGDASGDFGRVRALFTVLNATMNKSQIRFVWPSIMALCGVNSVLADVAKEMTEVRVPSKTTALPPGLLVACRRTAATISMASLVPAEVVERPLTEGSVETVDQQKYTEQGLGDFFGL